MKKNQLLCPIILIIIQNIMTREELNAEKKERAEARINSALQTFADMIIARMETIEASNWKKGWTDGEAMIGLPQNVTGRVYTGSNAFLCQLHTMKKNYKVPVYFTHKQIRDLGAHPKKGEKSIPIFKWGLSIYNRENGKKATLKEYDSLPKEERDEKYKVIPYLKIFKEWNIDQTNLEEVNKEKYDALRSKFETKEIKDDKGMYCNAAIDQMLASQSWVCPVEYNQQNPSALYNKSKDLIIVPRKDQFKISDTPEEIYKDGEEYYSSLIHEMAHSTGHESRLNRLNPDGKFGGSEYAKEELVAELTAAMVGSALGFDSRIRDNNTAYIKSWMSALKKEPKFLLSVMSDVNKASAMVIEHIDEQRVKLGEKALLEGNLDGEEEREKNEKEMENLSNENQENAQLGSTQTFAPSQVETAQNEETALPEEQQEVELNQQENSAAEVKESAIDEIPVTSEENALSGKKYFTILMNSFTDGEHEGHSALNIKSISELRDYFKDNSYVNKWMNSASNRELIESGADRLPNIRYPHQEGRTIHDMNKAYDHLISQYAAVKSMRTRLLFSTAIANKKEEIDNLDHRIKQIAHRVEQAQAIIYDYQANISRAYGN